MALPETGVSAVCAVRRPLKLTARCRQCRCETEQYRGHKSCGDRGQQYFSIETDLGFVWKSVDRQYSKQALQSSAGKKTSCERSGQGEQKTLREQLSNETKPACAKCTADCKFLFARCCPCEQ